YRKGLTGKRAEWAVSRMKSYRRVGAGAMISVSRRSAQRRLAEPTVGKRYISNF
ncbi:hypothetical protein FOMPIDRAFT_61103, partial [Fomitopsis schrenkii]